MSSEPESGNQIPSPADLPLTGLPPNPGSGPQLRHDVEVEGREKSRVPSLQAGGIREETDSGGLWGSSLPESVPLEENLWNTLLECPGCMGEKVIENYSCSMCSATGKVTPWILLEETRRQHDKIGNLSMQVRYTNQSIAKALRRAFLRGTEQQAQGVRQAAQEIADELGIPRDEMRRLVLGGGGRVDV